jgi:hypothetical protein
MKLQQFKHILLFASCLLGTQCIPLKHQRILRQSLVTCPNTKECNQPAGIIEGKWESAGKNVGSK